MTVFFATLRVKREKAEQFEKLQRELSKLTHEAEPDTVVYDVINLRSGDTSELEGHLVRSKGVVALGRDLRPELALRAWWLG